MALLADHMRETISALGRAEIARVYAVFGELVQLVVHSVYLWLVSGEIGVLEMLTLSNNSHILLIHTTGLDV